LKALTAFERTLRKGVSTKKRQEDEIVQHDSRVLLEDPGYDAATISR
jgi:hypothetical protein